jgi:hypothetical protein
LLRFGIKSIQQRAISDVIVIPAPADHSNDGLHIVYYYVVYADGSVSEILSLTVLIDTVPPEIMLIHPLGSGLTVYEPTLELKFKTEVDAKVWVYVNDELIFEPEGFERRAEKRGGSGGDFSPPSQCGCRRHLHCRRG